MSLLMSSTLCQRQTFDGLLEKWDRDIDILNRNRNLLLPAGGQKSQTPQHWPLASKRSPQGSRFSLSLDVPTRILSVLIDLAKNQDMHAKAAANAELMARVGKRK